MKNNFFMVAVLSLFLASCTATAPIHIQNLATSLDNGGENVCAKLMTRQLYQEIFFVGGKGVVTCARYENGSQATGSFSTGGIAIPMSSVENTALASCERFRAQVMRNQNTVILPCEIYAINNDIQ